MHNAPDKRTLGLIVNPLAGIGGSVGLKGSDGAETVARALALGAVQRAPSRAIETLTQLKSCCDYVNLVTFPGDMGANEAISVGLDPRVIGEIGTGQTSAEHTKRAALAMRDAAVDLLLFVGGDGTARDIYSAIGDTIPVLGIPAGVKIHSSVYAVNPQRAALLVEAFLENKTTLSSQEVMDIDEELFRRGQVSARLYGYLKVPYERRFLQGGKVGSKQSANQTLGIADHVIETLEDDSLYILGPGTTVKAITDRLGIEKTLLGVDLLLNKELILLDANEQQILDAIRGRHAKIIVTVIGGQGFIFGRGNQQISASVIRAVGNINIIVIATQGKLMALGGPLLVDTGDAACNEALAGYVRVVTGYHRLSPWKVRA